MHDVHRKLREVTAEAHAAIEKVALATRFLEDPVAYGRYLAALHGFHRGVEEALLRVPDLERWLPDLAARRKAAWLASDLAALGIAVPGATFEASVPDVATALGVGYVTEGSTLGGRWILAHLAPAIPAEARQFFGGYGAETGARFRAYCRAVEAHPDPDAVASAAVQTFRDMQSWISSAFPCEEPACGSGTHGIQR